MDGISNQVKGWWRGVEVKTYKSCPKGMVFLINKKILEAGECMTHHLDYAFFEGSYRRYRRGKNRCKRCGLKILN